MNQNLSNSHVVLWRLKDFFYYMFQYLSQEITTLQNNCFKYWIDLFLEWNTDFILFFVSPLCTAFIYSHYKKLNIFKTLVSLSGEGSSARNSSAQKNCSTPKSRLLDTVRADDKNICICSKIKKVCRTCLVEQMHFLDQNVQLLE